jgi:DNA repair protein RadC
MMLLHHLKRIKAAHAARWALSPRRAARRRSFTPPATSPPPSADDRLVTQSLRQAREILGERLIDHIIFSPREIYSFLDHGEL